MTAPVVTLMGTTLDVSVFNTNIENIWKWLQANVDGNDLQRVNRVKVAVHASGRIQAVRTFANPFRGTPHRVSGDVEHFDINTKHASLGDPAVLAATRIVEIDGMELLGFPGKSMFYDWQEDGFAETSISAAGVTDFPVTLPDRYPPGAAYSRWLTIPGASLRVFVPYRCIARVKAQALIAFAGHEDYAYPVRFGLIVDTNPVVHVGEFPNANPNIVDPVTGATATWRSWQVIEDVTMVCGLRNSPKVWGKASLQGGRWYSFRLAFRRAGHIGHVADDGATQVFQDGLWETSSGNVNSPVYPETVSLHQWQHVLMSLTDSSALQVEFHYGRGFNDIESYPDGEFESMFRTVDYSAY
jgi:hypothetical protein